MRRQRDLSLDALHLEMSREPVSSLTHERLMDLAGRLRLSDDLVGSRTPSLGTTYARNLVCRTPTSSCSCCAGGPVRSRPSTTTPER